MDGSDVVIVGMVGTKCFATDYYLNGKQPCDPVSVVAPSPEPQEGGGRAFHGWSQMLRQRLLPEWEAALRSNEWWQEPHALSPNGGRVPYHAEPVPPIRGGQMRLTHA